jgi:aryl-alcohol dehydrogenase-like predicted oxidoreductase
VNKNLLGSALQVSEICIGTGSFGVHLRQAGGRRLVRTLDAALERGINFMDTGLSYGAGIVENFLGKYLQSRPTNNIVICTTIPPYDSTTNRFSLAYPKGWIETATRTSLRLLKREYIDLQLLHTWDDGWSPTDSRLDELYRLKTSGLVCEIGLSVKDNSPSAAMALVQYQTSLIVQVPINPLRYKAMLPLYHFCTTNGVPLLGRMPFEHGNLLSPPNRSQLYSLFHAASKRPPSCSAARSLILFSTTLPKISSTVVGMTRVRHVIQNTTSVYDDLFETPVAMLRAWATRRDVVND